MQIPSPVIPDRWSLNSWFTAFGAEDYAAFKIELVRDLKAQVPPAGGDLPGLALAVAGYEGLMARFWHLSAYLGCLSADDAANEAVKADEAWAAALEAECSKLKASLQGAVASLEDAAFTALVADPVLKGASHAVKRMREDGRRQMAQDMEGLAADLCVPLELIEGGAGFQVAEGHVVLAVVQRLD